MKYILFSFVFVGSLVVAAGCSDQPSTYGGKPNQHDDEAEAREAARIAQSAAESSEYRQRILARESLQGAGCDFGVRSVLDNFCIWDLSNFYDKKLKDDLDQTRIGIRVQLDSVFKHFKSTRWTNANNKKFIAFYAFSNIKDQASNFCGPNGLIQKELKPFLAMLDVLAPELQRIATEMHEIETQVIAQQMTVEQGRQRYARFAEDIFVHPLIKHLKGDLTKYLEQRDRIKEWGRGIISIPSEFQLKAADNRIWYFSSILHEPGFGGEPNHFVKTVASAVSNTRTRLRENSVAVGIMNLQEESIGSTSLMKSAVDSLTEFDVGQDCFGSDCRSEAARIRREMQKCVP